VIDGFHQSVSGGSPEGIGGSWAGSFFALLRRWDANMIAAATAAEPMAAPAAIAAFVPLEEGFLLSVMQCSMVPVLTGYKNK